MIWSKWHFYLIDITNLNKKIIQSVKYSSFNSDTRRVLHYVELMIPLFKVSLKIDHDDTNDFFDMGENDNFNDFQWLSADPITDDQEEQSELIKDLGLSKESAELLASIVKGKKSPLGRNTSFI